MNKHPGEAYRGRASRRSRRTPTATSSLTGKQAVEYGLVDEVIVTRPGKVKV
jgi:ATP-dependent protease ClpP protease subunit